MTDIRDIARALVADAPEPPPMPAVGESARSRRPLVVLAAATTTAAAVIGVVALVGDDPPPVGVETKAPAAAPSVCSGTPPIEVTAPGATGPVEVRWPAPAQPRYGDGDDSGPVLGRSEKVSPGRSEIDLHVPGADTRVFEPDIVVQQAVATAVPPAPCDVVQVAAVIEGARWVGGFRVTSDGTFEQVDLQPRIVERRVVDAAPRTAITCRGSDRSGTPPNRSGGPNPALRGPQPADVLVAYLAATPTAPSSGYVEMAESDGSITYGGIAGDEWTILLFVERDADGWHLEGWTSSGC